MLRSLVSFLIVLILLSSCNRKSLVLEYTNAKDEVPQLGNLSFRFSKKLAPDSMLNIWDSSQYISFEPAIEGRFRWEHPDELVFSPAKPLLPATTYKATLHKLLLKNTDASTIKKAGDIIFHTPALALENINARWVQADGGAIIPQVDLYFNYPVTPDALKEKLKLVLDENEAQWQLQTVSASNKISVHIASVKPEDRDYHLNIILEKGLIPDGGTNGLEQTAEQSALISSPYELNINDISSEHDGVTGTITVKTSQQPLQAQLSQWIKLEPALAYNTEITEDGFVISSDKFDAANSYSLKLLKGLRGRIGGVLKEDYSAAVAFGQLEPSLSFSSSKGVYLGGKGARNIEINITNVPKVKLIVSRIYESNILAAHRYGYYPSEKDAGEEDSEYESEGDATLGDVVYEKEIDTRSLPKYNSGRLLKFDMEEKLPDFKGIYHIKIRSTKDYWISDSRFISVSDIGLIAKEGVEKMLVFANSIKTAQPLKDVSVAVYGNNNQLIGMGNTSADGLAEIAYTRKEFAGFKPAMIIAKAANDFNYLPFQSTRVGTSRFDVGGRRINSTGLDAFVYPERDMYRPGERMNCAIIVRDRQFNNPGELPLKIKMLLPNGKELASFRKALNAQGTAEANVQLPSTALTGTYVMEVYNGNDVLLATQNLKVEEFMPDRIKVTAKLDKETLTPNATASLGIQAVNYFGPPAANRNYECEIQVKAKSFRPNAFHQYNFDLANPKTFFEKIVRQGMTNATGAAQESFAVPDLYANQGLLQARFIATVFDETGRPVSRTAAAEIVTQPVFLGLGQSGYNYYALNQPASFSLVALNAKEQPLNTQAQVEVIKHEYRTVLAKSGDLFRYESQQEDKLLASQTITVSGINTKYSFIPRTSGNYEIRVRVPGSPTYISENFYSYGGWGTNNNSFEVSTEGHVTIELNKEQYNKGDIVKALFKAPFNGRMLVTVETDRVLSHQYVDVKDRTAMLDLKLSEEHLPNAYITATLFKPHEVSDIPLTVAHGFKNVKVEDKDKRMGVSISAATHVRSRTHQKVTVKAAPNSMVTLAAVDEGVLAVSNFKTPDPYTFYYAQRALNVFSYDLYPLLFPELRARLSSTGGDADLEMNQRQNPVANKRVKLLSFWSGVQQTNSSGNASFEFDVPQFSGNVRLMAVACNNNRFGAAELGMTVADPLVLSTALPRFMSPADTVLMPVTIANTTSRSTVANATVKVQGPLGVIGAATQAVQVNANSEGVALFKIAAASAIAPAKITVEVSGLGEKFVDETDIVVRPASTLQKMSGAGMVNANQTQNIAIGASDFIPQSLQYNLVISRSPVLQLGSQLQWLVNYPYGCTEQTISCAFPQLYYTDISELMKTGTHLRQAAMENVNAAISKIKMRQLYNGAIALWDDESSVSWWTTAYAAHFLIEAQKAGYSVDKSLLETMLNYLSSRLRNKETINYFYNRNLQKKIAPKEVVYSLYVLAMAGRPNVAAMNYYKANQTELALDSRYLLAVAYALGGDRQKYNSLLPAAFVGEESVAESGGSFYSDIRDESMALNALIEVAPDHPQIQVMARHVADKLKARSWYTTQEAAFGLLAMGKLASKSNKTNSTATVSVGGKQVGAMQGAALKLDAAALRSTQVQVNVKGNGPVYYWWQSQGISASGEYQEEDSYVKIRRVFYDRYGRIIDGNTFKQNDLIVVQLTLDKAYSGNIDNMVVTDILPAGFEIENPRVKELPGMDWVKDAATPVHLDVRDDRIHFFTNMHSGRRVFYYVVRAVSTGIFRMGPASADAMYNGEYHSYHGGGIIRVEQ